MRRFNITFPGGTHVFNCKIVLFEVLIRGQVPNRKKVLIRGQVPNRKKVGTNKGTGTK